MQPRITTQGRIRDTPMIAFSEHQNTKRKTERTVSAIAEDLSKNNTVMQIKDIKSSPMRSQPLQTHKVPCHTAEYPVHHEGTASYGLSCLLKKSGYSFMQKMDRIMETPFRDRHRLGTDTV